MRWERRPARNVGMDMRGEWEEGLGEVGDEVANNRCDYISVTCDLGDI